MKLHNVSGLVTILLAAVFLTVLFSAAAQTSPANSTATSASVEVPRWIRFSGIAQNETGKPLPGTLGITFALYKDQQGGAPLWLETQNVRADAAGHYIALLGSATAEGVPLSLFSSAEVHWIGVQVSGYPEQPRVLLLSVPYALKAVDAETLGGLPASAFVQANPAGAATATTSRTTAQPAIAPSSGHASSKPASVPPPATVTGAGTTDYIPLWTSASALGNSLLFQTGGNVGVGTTTPGAKLDSAGTNITIRGTSSGTTGVGVVGKATSTTGVNFGVKGATASTANGSAGVSGAATGTTGQVDGVYGSTSSTTQGADGVKGIAGAATGVVSGVGGSTNSASNFAAGVSGLENAATGQNFGVQGAAFSATNGAAGVIGSAEATTGQVYGVSGGTSSTTNGAAAVNGYEGAATGQVYGVSGGTNSGAGAGVSGYNAATVGGIGVSGTTAATTGFANGVQGTSSSTSGDGVSGTALATTGSAFGVYGQSDSVSGSGVSGNAVATSGFANGVYGQTASPSGSGVFGQNNSTAGGYGVTGTTNSTVTNATGVFGYEGATTGQVYGVSGSTNTTTSYAAGVSGFEGATTGDVYGVHGGTSSATAGASGVSGVANATTGGVYGVSGYTPSVAGVGVLGSAYATTGNTTGSMGTTVSSTGIGVFGLSTATTGGKGVQAQTESTSGGAAGVFVAHGGAGLLLSGLSGSSFTNEFYVDAAGNGFFAGNLNVTGKLTKGSGSFKIDDPLDPANKYLSHSFVESPDMMNVYNGNITTNKHGFATVILPNYFEALNRDFRYQLTVIGQFAEAIVARKIANNQFLIRTSKPGVEVSWQVTGIRHDAYANANRIPVEEVKPPQEQGHYLHPDLFGASPEQSIGAVSSR